MLEAVGSALTEVIGWVGEVVTSLVSAEGALSGLLPLFAIGVACSALFFGVKAIKSCVWGA